ncbi:DUF3179 domain-containing protein [bacterium]|nr:DUF3179 domain-containing protein [bacterium]
MNRDFVMSAFRIARRNNRCILPLLLLSTVLWGCEESEEGSNWLVPEDMIVDGGVGRDGIPALEDPDTAPPAEIAYLEDNDLVLGVQVNGDLRAYPHAILNYHEIANDTPGGEPWAVTFCPLTGSGIAWDRILDNNVTTFGVSGLLLDNNLIAYDRATDSHWTQMGLTCIEGEYIRETIVTRPLVEMSWGMWQNCYPESEVLTTDTGYERLYEQDPYGDYRTDHNEIRYSLSLRDNRLPNKTRVLGVIHEFGAKAYEVNAGGDNVEVIEDVARELPVVILRYSQGRFANAFKRVLNGDTLSFSPLQNSRPVMMESTDGTRWDLFGRAVDGPRAGQTLERPNCYVAYWFAWAAFYPGLDLFEE